MVASRKGKKAAKKLVKKGVGAKRTGVTRRAVSNRSTILEVDHPSKVRAFESALKKGMSIVLVYAEWCGACHRFRDNIWSKVCSKDKGAAMNRLSVRDDMVRNTSLAGAKYDYLPAILAVGPDGKPAAFTTPEGKMTNAMPTPQTEEEMTQVVNARPSNEEEDEDALASPEEEASEESLYEPLTLNEEPPVSMSMTNRPNTARPNTPRPNTARPNTPRPNTARPNTPRPNTARPNTPFPQNTQTSVNTMVNNSKNSRIYSPIPQSLPEEAIKTAQNDTIPVTPLRAQQGGGCGCGLQIGGRRQSGGGNLFQTLVAISRGALPAAALAASAVYMTRRRARSQKKAAARGKTQKKSRGHGRRSSSSSNHA